MALEGINKHWSRNTDHVVAKDVKIGEESYQVYVQPINTKENAMDDVALVFNTNNKWMRSGNPGFQR